MRHHKGSQFHTLTWWYQHQQLALVNYLQFLMTHSLGNQKLCEKVAKMIMVHFATFFSQECLWQSGMCRDFGIWFMIWYKTDGLDLHLMYGNFSQAIEWLRQYEIWGQIISSTILANWFTDHWFKCLHGFITGLWLLYEALNVISLVLSSKVHILVLMNHQRIRVGSMPASCIIPHWWSSGWYFGHWRRSPWWSQGSQQGREQHFWQLWF